MEKYNLAAPCLFGVEGILADELRRLGVENVAAENGRVLFTGDNGTIAKVNINSRFAERVMIVLGSFNAVTFTELFDNVAALPLEEFIGKTDAFPVKGSSLNSALHSIPDCQSIIKKACVERLKKVYKTDWFDETGPVHQLQFTILKDKVTLMLDTSGQGLHKRGYRADSNAAPIKETLAAAMCDLARIFPDTVLYDPFCGSGTILIEAALMAKKQAPGLRRFFAAERFSFIPEQVWRNARNKALDRILPDVEFRAHGTDIDPNAVRLTLENAKKAGVEKYITAEVADIKDFKITESRAKVITNPPYGERLLDIKSAEDLYKTMGERFIRDKGKQYYIISPHDEFEKFFGAVPDKKRKLYNGMIKCDLNMYFENN